VMVDKQGSGGGGGEYDFAPQEPQGEIPFEKPLEKPAEKVTESTKKAVVQEPLLEERICPHCGFKILGKAPKGRCPECTAILDEAAIGQLQFAEKGWLNAMANGSLMLAIAVVAQGAVVALGWTHILTLTAWIGAAGVWLLTSSEAGGAVKLPLRFGARWVAIIVAILWTAAMTKENPIVAVAALVATACQGALVALHLRMLAMRIPNEGVARQFLNLAFFLPGISMVLIVAHLIGQTDIWSMKEWLICGLTVEGLMGLVMLWAAVTLLRLAIELRNCVVAGQNIETRKHIKMQQQEKERQEREQRRR